MKEAIQKAIEGGYKMDAPYINYNCELLHPLFWQALGKSLGWPTENVSVMWNKNGETFDVAMVMWENKWHCFIDHLAEGKDPELFFFELLKLDK